MAKLQNNIFYKYYYLLQNIVIIAKLQNKIFLKL